MPGKPNRRQRSRRIRHRRHPARHLRLRDRQQFGYTRPATQCSSTPGRSRRCSTCRNWSASRPATATRSSSSPAARRPQTQTDATVASLASAGYAKPRDGHLFLKPTTPPSYLHCANAPTCTTIEYKSGTRAHIASEGYTIMADFGDQYGDLLGGNAGHQRRSRPSPASWPWRGRR
ncbi:MAG TPA: HAD family acid phosphatase [Streptosporangiaceae bacterium]|nr:HAD family acid phosphatase [Streptosporangiaceae bacterium]